MGSLPHWYAGYEEGHSEEVADRVLDALDFLRGSASMKRLAKTAEVPEWVPSRMISAGLLGYISTQGWGSGAVALATPDKVYEGPSAPREGWPSPVFTPEQDDLIRAHYLDEGFNDFGHYTNYGHHKIHIWLHDAIARMAILNHARLLQAIAEHGSPDRHRSKYRYRGASERKAYEMVAQKQPNGVSRTVGNHRVLMEEYLGRPLEANEVVHHIDGDPIHNSPDNLLLCTSSSEHHLIHGTYTKLLPSLIRNGIIYFDHKTRSYQIREEEP